MIDSRDSSIGTLLFDNKEESETVYFLLKNEIFDNLKLDVIWNNSSSITPEFGEIRFRYREIDERGRKGFVNDIHDQVTRTSSSAKLSLVLSAKETVEVSIMWRVGKKHKLLNRVVSSSLLGYVSIIPKRQNCMLLNLPLGFTPVRSHLVVNYSVFPLGEMEFDRVYSLKLALTNTSDEAIDFTTKPCSLLASPIEEVLKPREKRIISLDLSLSARVITNGTVNCPIVFYSPSNTINQATCMVRATVTNPTVVKYPQLQSVSDGLEMTLQNCWMRSYQDGDSHSITPLVIENLRDIDVFLTIHDPSNQFTFVDEKGVSIQYICVGQESQVTAYLMYSPGNRFFKNETKNYRGVNGSFVIAGFTSIPTSESETPSEDHRDFPPLFTNQIHYTGKVGIARFGVSQPVFHIVSNQRPIQNHGFDFEVLNKNTGIPFPFKIEVQDLSNPSIQVILSKTEGTIKSSISINVSVTCLIPGYSSFTLKVSHIDGIVSKDIDVNLFNRNNYISILPSVPLSDTPAVVTTIHMGNIAVTKYNQSPYFAINPAGSEQHSIQVTNNGGIPVYLVPYSNFPVQIEQGNSDAVNETASPLSVHRNSSLTEIPPFMLDENASIPSLLESKLYYSTCGKCIEILPDQTVELLLYMKPREYISRTMSEKLDKPKYQGKLPFSGNICFFSSRGDNLFQQLMNIEGVFYQEDIQVSSQMANFGIIFANTSRYPRIDVRIDNNSCSSVTVDLSRLPRGFIPSQYYLFSQHHHSQILQHYGIDRENDVVTMRIDADCYASLILELDMKVIDWVEGQNEWTLPLSTLSSPDRIIPLTLQGTVLSSVLSVRKNDHPIEAISWEQIHFPSLEDQVYEIELVNSSPREAHVQSVFQQTQFKQVFGLEMIPDVCKLKPQEHVTVRLVHHTITIHTLTQNLVDEMKSCQFVGQLQFIADCSLKNQNDVTRTITDLPLYMSFGFESVISVYPSLLNLVTIVDHFSKMNELMINHFDLSSPQPSSSSPMSPLSPRYSDIGLDDQRNESQDNTEIVPKSDNPSSHLSFVTCHLDKNCYEFVITNHWRERMTVSLQRTHLDHRQHAVIYPGYPTPVFASWIEVPDTIVVESKTSVAVVARITPDLTAQMIPVVFDVIIKYRIAVILKNQQ